MARRLPPLNSIRCFEAAARHLSFTLAAEELFVTQSAVSQQIKLLESWLGQPLFTRKNRQLFLTDAGQAYLPEVRSALDKLANATAKLQQGEMAGKLVVTVLPSFASKWLLPRMGRFNERYPDITVQFIATEHVVDFAKEDVDIGLRYGKGMYPGLKSEVFLREKLFPVCSPRFVKGKSPLKSPKDLRKVTLLHDHMTRDDWRVWLLEVGEAEVDHSVGPTFNHSNHLLDAAIHGQGVAMGRMVLATEDLRTGRLVKPFDYELASNYAYYLVCPEEKFEQTKVQAFWQWIKEEAEKPENEL